LLVHHKLTETAINYSLQTVARTNRIARILGENWQVLELARQLLLHQSDDTRGLLLY
jgi:hypothetical protein